MALLSNNGRSDGRAFRVLLLDASSKGVGTAQLGTGSSTCAQVLISTHASPGVLRFLEELVKVNTLMPSVRISVIRTRGSTGAVKVRWTQMREPTRGGAGVPESDVGHSGTLHFQGGERAKSFDIPIECEYPTLSTHMSTPFLLVVGQRVFDDPPASPFLASRTAPRLVPHCAIVRDVTSCCRIEPRLGPIGAARSHHQFRVSLSDPEGGALVGLTAATMLVMVVPPSTTTSPLRMRLANASPSQPVLLAKARSPSRTGGTAHDEVGAPTQLLQPQPSQPGAAIRLRFAPHGWASRPFAWLAGRLLASGVLQHFWQRKHRSRGSDRRRLRK